LIEKGGSFPQADGVKPIHVIVLLLAATFLTGCQKSADVAPTPSIDNQLPTQAQPKLPTMKIYLGAEILETELALAPREQQTGMMFRANVTDESAMLFVLPRAMHAPEGFG